MSSTLWPSLKPRTLLANLQDRVSRRARRWARKRQGADAGTIRLGSGRVYILPTGVGLIFALMCFAMLLGSMNYNNNLSFVLTFILVGVGFVAMHQCQRNLVGLEVSNSGCEPVFAGQSLQFKISISNRSKSARFGIRIYDGKTQSDVQDLLPGESKLFVLPVATDSRGYVDLPRFGIRTLFPFELFRAWSWSHMDLRGLVYPKPADDAPEPPATTIAHGHRQHDARGEEDFAGLRKYAVGDSPRHIAWKAYARGGKLLSKRFSGADTSSQWFDFDEIPLGDTEERLSILTHWIIETDRTSEDYGLRLPGAEFEPTHGAEHRRRCLEALALFAERPS